MVKADPKRDYYADLELSGTADTEEIKKQFRLLAKLYHPDRNRGHEVEFVDKFQAIQAAHEILIDPTEKAKYDIARAKRQQRTSAPPPPRDDPYEFRRPAAPARTQTTGPVPSGASQPKSRPTFTPTQTRTTRPQAASPGANRFAAFTRGQPQQTWTKERYEEAARAEAARGFSTMRSQPPPPQMPPRPPRQHPTAPRPPSAGAAAEQQYAQNGQGAFPGMARTRRQPSGEESQPRSAFSYVRAGQRPPSATAAHGTEAYNSHSPLRERTAASPLRHARSTDYAMDSDRPQMYPRADGRYSSNRREKTDLHGAGLTRSASVRTSPVDPRYGDDHTGAFGRSKTQQSPPHRHRSASPKFRTASFSSSDSSGDEISMRAAKSKADSKPKMNIRTQRVRPRTNDGMDQQVPSTNYTRVKEDSNTFEYPAPLSKQPTRHPFPNMTSPDEAHPQERSPFSPTEHQGPKPNDVFQAAKFSHNDWADKLKSTSPVKKGSKSRRTPMSKSDNSPDDAMDVDEAKPATEQKPQTNGINLDDLKNQAPLNSEGLNGVHDLKSSLPWESKASTHVRTDSRPTGSRLKISDYPPPPKTISPPALDRLNDENWKAYVRTMQEYMESWNTFDTKMIEHFRLRRERLNSCMNENWISMPSDGPRAERIDQMNGSGVTNGAGGLQAGYGAYMQWLKDDEDCHGWWETAREKHRGVLEELGQVRDRIMGNQETA